MDPCQRVTKSFVNIRKMASHAAQQQVLLEYLEIGQITTMSRQFLITNTLYYIVFQEIAPLFLAAQANRKSHRLLQPPRCKGVEALNTRSA